MRSYHTASGCIKLTHPLPMRLMSSPSPSTSSQILTPRSKTKMMSDRESAARCRTAARPLAALGGRAARVRVPREGRFQEGGLLRPAREERHPPLDPPKKEGVVPRRQAGTRARRVRGLRVLWRYRLAFGMLRCEGGEGFIADSADAEPAVHDFSQNSSDTRRAIVKSIFGASLPPPRLANGSCKKGRRRC